MSVKAFSFLIVAGGGGRRVGGVSKQFRPLGGRPLWRWSLDLAFAPGIGIKEVVLALPQGHGITEDIPCPLPLKFAFGGPSRADSVKNGLKMCACDYVMVHDAARPFASPSLLQALAECTEPEVGAAPLLPLAEAVKRVERSGQIRAVDREGLYATQTPQSFFREALVQVLAKEDVSLFKDEAEAWLAAGMELRGVEGERLNFKITWPEDFLLAEAVATGRAGETRTGIGYDVHRLTPERPLFLGGVTIPSPLGLLGHSDADALAHAIADALLGAAGLPDIGNLFPASDLRYKDADSLVLLQQVAERTRREGWRTLWVDAVVVAQVPRLNEHLPLMRKRLSEAVNPGFSSGGGLCVNVKAKSAEGTDDPGAGRSIVCHAVATLARGGYQ
ncbi:MAG: 2-C-methyl-D-erythritol 2,4-cyclodiphosphate synthase [Synergistaceae bacterium]|jgi:2-C-methyl-D-erythritol 4-phosphate cytidylyltransferase/2-C-methyl-D-erythritol 2,4-cyclodiphosphate synthase|nr:2-C-methyl-D-erythritol 2,4-cyclodiphosphate synthase [Synergistaceae bacterium]